MDVSHMSKEEADICLHIENHIKKELVIETILDRVYTDRRGLSIASVDTNMRGHWERPNTVLSWAGKANKSGKVGKNHFNIFVDELNNSTLESLVIRFTQIFAEDIYMKLHSYVTRNLRKSFSSLERYEMVNIRNALCHDVNSLRFNFKPDNPVHIIYKNHKIQSLTETYAKEAYEAYMKEETQKKISDIMNSSKIEEIHNKLSLAVAAANLIGMPLDDVISVLKEKFIESVHKE